jgi:hypothetical protein
MAPVYARPRWVRIGSNAIAVVMLVGAVFGMAIGEWFATLPVAAGAVLILLANVPLAKIALARGPGAIVSRYVPWYEPGIYGALAMLILALFCVAAAFVPGYGGPFGFFGVALLILTPIVVLKFLRGYRRCSLRITPDGLSVPDPGREYVMTEIPRERIASIAPASEIVGFGSSTLQLTDITYATGDSGSAARTVRVGQAPAQDTVWLTLNPLHLRAGLQVWKDGDPNDPRLLDHVESVLRSGETSAAAPPEEH